MDIKPKPTLDDIKKATSYFHPEDPCHPGLAEEFAKIRVQAYAQCIEEAEIAKEDGDDEHTRGWNGACREIAKMINLLYCNETGEK